MRKKNPTTRLFARMSDSQIARALGISRSAVQQVGQRAERKLKRALGNAAAEYFAGQRPSPAR